jgi:hypothetical protein
MRALPSMGRRTTLREIDTAISGDFPGGQATGIAGSLPPQGLSLVRVHGGLFSEVFTGADALTAAAGAPVWYAAGRGEV